MRWLTDRLSIPALLASLAVAFALFPPVTVNLPGEAVPAHHCVRSGSGWLCSGDPRNPHHEGEERIAGANRYETAVAISQAFWEPGEAQRVYLANGWSQADALAAGPSVDGPILLVGTGDTLPAVVADELARLAPTVAVVALGGESVVSPDVLAAAAVAAGFGQP